jgi:hypothetical protein
VPFVSPYVPQQPSPRIQELGQRVALLLAEFRQKYPDLSDEEVRQALSFLSDDAPDRPASARPAIAAVVAGVAVAAGLGVYLVGGRVALPHGAAFPAILAAAIAVIAAVVVRRRRE